MIIIHADGTVASAAPRYHAGLYASMRVIKHAFGRPDLPAAAAWIIRVDQPGRRCPKQVILRPDFERTGFDPRTQPGRPAWWEIISDADRPAALASVLGAVRSALPAEQADTLPTARPNPPAAAGLTGDGSSEPDGGGYDFAETEEERLQRLRDAFADFGAGGDVDDQQDGPATDDGTGSA